MIAEHALNVWNDLFNFDTRSVTFKRMASSVEKNLLKIPPVNIFIINNTYKKI